MNSTQEVARGTQIETVLRAIARRIQKNGYATQRLIAQDTNYSLARAGVLIWQASLAGYLDITPGGAGQKVWPYHYTLTTAGEKLLDGAASAATCWARKTR